MCAWSELVPTAEEKAQRYYEGIDLGGSLYDADAPDIPDTDQEQHTAAGPRDTAGLFSGPRDMEGLFSGPVDMEGLFSGRDDMDASPSGCTDTEGSGLEGGSSSPRRRSPVRSTGDPQVGKTINIAVYNFSVLKMF